MIYIDFQARSRVILRLLFQNNSRLIVAFICSKLSRKRKKPKKKGWENNVYNNGKTWEMTFAIVIRLSLKIVSISRDCYKVFMFIG